ncbi:hypothetical protein [Nocardioides sp.]|uniref:hypothetical protein n=1 Tax=Nocardioides sp. TaxID=35761 RepID=UPI0035187EA1
MSEDVDPTTGRRGGARLQWGIVGLLSAVLVASLGVTAYLVLDRGAGASPFARIESLRDPGVSPAQDRERALALGRTFAQRFNTYGPDLLDASGKMPDYAAVAGLMSAKFAKVFDENVGFAEETVKQTKVDRSAQVFSVGISSIDADSADLLVGGIVQFTYPNPQKPSERVPFEPLRFRYDVSLVKIGGVWKVDDLDDIDDGLPSFGEASQPQGGVPPVPGQPTQPSQSPSPSGSPSAPTTPAPSATTAPSQGSTP